MQLREDCQDKDISIARSDDYRYAGKKLQWTPWHEVMMFTTDEKPDGWKTTTAQFFQGHVNKVYFKHFPGTYQGIYEWKVTIKDSSQSSIRSLVFYLGKGENIQKRIANERTSPTIGLGRIITPILESVSDDIEAVFSVRASPFGEYFNLVEIFLLKSYDYCGNGSRVGYNGRLRYDDAIAYLGISKDVFEWHEIERALDALNVDAEEFRRIILS